MNCWSRQSSCLTTFRDSFDSSTVDVIVGEAEQKFIVHKAVLSHIAPFFRAAREGNFRESSEQKITMPEASPEVFRRFLLWAHSGSLLGHQERVTDLSAELLAHLYIFGDTLGVSHLQNSVMDSLGMWVKSERRFPLWILHLVYKNTRRGCALQRYLVDRTAFTVAISKEGFEEQHLESYPAAFLADLVLVLYDVQKGTIYPIKNDKWDKIGCRYHFHPPDNQKTPVLSGGNSNTSRALSES